MFHMPVAKSGKSPAEVWELYMKVAHNPGGPTGAPHQAGKSGAGTGAHRCELSVGLTRQGVSYTGLLEADSMLM